MDELFKPLIHLTGASPDQIKLIFCFLISYPLGSVYVRLPRSRPALKHIFSIIVSAFFLLPILNLWFGALQLLFTTLATYVLAMKLRGPNMPWVVFAVVMGHLTLNHIYRVVYNISLDTFEITGPQMVLVMKLTVFAWNVWDGRRPIEELDQQQLKTRVITMPSLLEFLGYAFYFPGVLIGPYTEYTTYASLVDGSLFETAQGKKEVGARVERVPRGRKRAAYTRMVSGFIFLGIYVVFGGKYSFESVLTDAWLQRNLPNRLFTVQIIGFVQRTKYYAVWSLTEGACIFTGLGFTGFTTSGDTRWDGAANVKFLLIECPSNFKGILDSWNIKANIWLKETVYKRVARKGKKPGFKSSMVTSITSAFWHGIGGGYYLTFLLGGFVTTAGRLCRAYFRPLVLPLALETGPQPESHSHEADKSRPSIVKRVYDFIGSLASVMILNFTVVPFVICDFFDSLEAWRRMDWYGLWMVGGVLFFFSVGGKRWMKSLAQSRKRREQEKVDKTREVKVDTLNGGAISSPGPHVVPVDMMVSEAMKHEMWTK